MKKSNVILQAAIASALLLMVGSAQAATVSVTAPVFAKELLQGSTPAATALIFPTANAITVVSNVSIPASSTVYVYVKLTGASISTIPSVAPPNALALIEAGAAGTSVTLTAANLGTTTGSVNPAAVGAGVDYIVFKLVTGTTPVGVGGTVAIIGGVASGGGTSVPLQVNNAAALLTAPITVTASVGIGAPATRFGTLPAAASNYDATSTAVNLATQAQGITLVAAASTSAGTIDLSATPPGSLFASAFNTNTIDLGSMTATNGTAVQADGATAYSIASQVTAATKLTAIVTAPAGFFAPLGTSGQLWLEDGACTAASATGAASGAAMVGSPSTVFGSTALASAATSVALNGTAVPVSATVYHVCMGITKTIAAIEGTPTLAGTLVHALTTVDSSETVAATLWALAYNGTSTAVRLYVPASKIGFAQNIRVVNTGAAAAPITFTMIGENGATIGVPYTTPILGVGLSTRVTQAALEAGVGVAPVSSARPRLTITAPTNALEVQSLMYSNGVFTNMSGLEQ